MLSLPKKTVTLPAEFYPVFRGSLLQCFDEKQRGVPHREAAAADDWADVEMDKTTGKVDIIEKSAPAAPAGDIKMPPKVEFLPSAESLPRPDELLSRPPYHLIVYDLGRQKIEIHCSHSRSLQLLSEYLKRWCRVNHNDTRNVSRP